jgi:hypothetical protein
MATARHLTADAAACPRVAVVDGLAWLAIGALALRAVDLRPCPWEGHGGKEG